MLSLPTTGFRRSVNSHNVELMAIGDWLEASLLFGDDDRISVDDVVDVLTDEHVYDDQDFAKEMVGNAWAELLRRTRCLEGAAAYSVGSESVRRLTSWSDSVALSFCLTLSLRRWYQGPGDGNYAAQGRLFERLAEASLKQLLPGWSVLLVGWGPGGAAAITEVAGSVARHVGVAVGDLDLWAPRAGNDGGLDVVASLPFPDGRPHSPVLLVQCASGQNWEAKRSSPCLDTWSNLVGFYGRPVRGMAMPYAIEDDLFRYSSVEVGGLFLDRERLLCVSATGDSWLPNSLQAELTAFVDAAVARLRWYE